MRRESAGATAKPITETAVEAVRILMMIMTTIVSARAEAAINDARARRRGRAAAPWIATAAPGRGGVGGHDPAPGFAIVSERNPHSALGGAGAALVGVRNAFHGAEHRHVPGRVVVEARPGHRADRAAFAGGREGQVLSD